MFTKNQKIFNQNYIDFSIQTTAAFRQDCNAAKTNIKTLQPI